MSTIHLIVTETVARNIKAIMEQQFLSSELRLKAKGIKNFCLKSKFLNNVLIINLDIMLSLK